MAEIIINEISQNYSYVVNDTSFATVALPITSSWGPGFFDPKSYYGEDEQDGDDRMKDQTVWTRFPATQEGVEAFVSAYRGPVENYRLAQDFSYHAALSLLTSGYAVLTCRLSQGDRAQATLTSDESDSGVELGLKAKYPGTFGNRILCVLNHEAGKPNYNLVIYTVDSTETRYAVENLSFVVNAKDSTDEYPHYEELESNFITFDVVKLDNSKAYTKKEIKLEGGTDSKSFTTMKDCYDSALSIVKGANRYNVSNSEPSILPDYVSSIKNLEIIAPGELEPNGRYAVDETILQVIQNREWIFAKAAIVYDLLKDKLAYNPNRIMSPCWDDQDTSIWSDEPLNKYVISPLTSKLLECAASSRCGVSYVDVPRTMPRSKVYEYVKELSNSSSISTNSDGLYTTHSAIFGPWGTYKYVGVKKYQLASPSFITLLVQKSMIENQTLQYEWIQPSTRTNHAKIGKLDYTVPKSTLDEWQPEPDTEGGVGVNALTTVPGLGLTIWGDSTLYNNQPATYQALRNLSTRLLVNAIKDVAYKAGVSITFNYNNQSAYSKFYVSVTPLLETMKNAGAIEDFKVEMSHDLDAIGQIKANSCVGKIYIVPVGTIQRINIDLIALPPGTVLS